MQLSARVDSQINLSVVVHGRMQDLPRGQLLFGGGGGCDTWHSHAFARGFGGMLPRKKNFNGAISCVFS